MTTHADDVTTSVEALRSFQIKRCRSVRDASSGVSTSAGSYGNEDQLLDARLIHFSAEKEKAGCKSLRENFDFRFVTFLTG